MEIFVCIKQVPDTVDVKINPETNTLMRDGVPSIVNPFDLYALEEAIRIREKKGGKVTVITMGPPQAKNALLECISMGADEAVLISDRAFAGSDTLATSYTLAAAIKTLGGADIIFFGKQAIDGDTAQVGPGVAECMDIPFVAFVKKIEELGEKSAKVQRLMEAGYDEIEITFPCVLTVVKEINEPRVPSLKGKMRAKKYEPKIMLAADLNLETYRLGLNGSPTQVIKVFSPELRKAGQRFEGPAEEIVDKLYNALKEDKIIP